jgi:YbbR domain-containing protein
MMRSIFTSHPLMKLLSLLLALALWIFVRGEKQKELNVNIPVKYQNLPTGMMMVGDYPDMIKLKLRGPKSRMAKLDDKFFTTYIIDLDGIKPGQNPYWIYAEDFKVPFGISVDRIQPQSFQINVAKSSYKSVPVTANLVGEPLEGYVVKSVKVDPPQVQIRSYNDLLNRISAFKTVSIDLEGRSRSFEGDFDIDRGKYKVTLMAEKVHVVVEIESKVAEVAPPAEVVEEPKETPPLETN